MPSRWRAALTAAIQGLFLQCGERILETNGGDPRVVLAVRGTHFGDELAPLVLEEHDRRLHRCLGLHGWHG